MKIYNVKLNSILLVILLLTDCALTLYIGIWREWFWTAVSSLQLSKFIYLISYFTVAAFISCFVSGYSQFLINYISLIWRKRLTSKALSCARAGFFHDTMIKGSKKLPNGAIEGFSQRVQEDCLNYPLLFLTILTGIFKNFVTLLIFIGIIVFQLGIIYLIFPVLYVIFGTLISAKIAKPLINLNYNWQVVEAKFRQFLFKSNYGRVHRVNYNLYKQTKYLEYFQSFYNQITIIVPFLILAPIYFSAKISFGILMQCTSSMGEVINSASYFINSFSDINKWLSCRKRLKELEII